MFRLITLAALVGYVSSFSLSSSCTTAVLGIAANADAAACLSPASPLLLLAGGADSSIVNPVNNWLTSLCAAPACSNATIEAVVRNVTTGCSQDLSDNGVGSSPSFTTSIVSLVEQYYPTVRKLLCLKDGNTNCITEGLTDIQNMIGTLSLNNLALLNTTTKFPANITCSNCNKAVFSIMKQDIPSLMSTVPDLESTCGASFADGTIPANILQSASNGSAGSSSDSTAKAKAAAPGSVSMMSQGVFAASGLVVISAFFTLLA